MIFENATEVEMTLKNLIGLGCENGVFDFDIVLKYDDTIILFSQLEHLDEFGSPEPMTLGMMFKDNNTLPLYKGNFKNINSIEHYCDDECKYIKDVDTFKELLSVLKGSDNIEMMFEPAKHYKYI